MNIKDLKNFLLSFNLSEDNITSFLDKKTLVEKDKNVFLVSQNFRKNQVFGDTLVFVNLIFPLPSRFLLDFIKENSEFTLRPSSSKQAMNFVYGKHFTFDGLKVSVQGKRLEKDNNYLVEFEDSVLGYVSLNTKEKLPLRNEMNIGMYLKEN